MRLSRMGIVLCLILSCVCAGRASAASASYTVTFDATWSQTTHPNAYPADAHFSALIGGVHSDQVSFWAPGGLASAGIEQMAEIGGTSALRSEVQAAINASTGLSVIQGSGIGSPGSTSVTLQLTSDFPLVTLVTMVAPSPDWFVGVHGLDLRDGAGWKNHVTVDLFPYDAGTEQGVGFSLSNPDTIPHQSIELLGFPFTSTDPRLGTYTFTRNFVGRPIGDYNDDGVVNAADYVVWRDTSGGSGLNLAADGDLDGTVDADDYDVWKTHFGETVAIPDGQSAVTGLDGNMTPEPATVFLAVITAAIMSFRRSKYRRRSSARKPAAFA